MHSENMSYLLYTGQLSFRSGEKASVDKKKTEENLSKNREATSITLL